MAPRAGAPRFDFADIVRQHRAALEQSVRLSTAQRQVLTDIALCRTSALGGHLDVCLTCGYEHPAYNSCRNRHCPKCQALAQQRWIEQQRQRLLDVPHFHVVFTMPAELRPLAAFAPTLMFGLLFTCAVSYRQTCCAALRNSAGYFLMALAGTQPKIRGLLRRGHPSDRCGRSRRSIAERLCRSRSRRTNDCGHVPRP